MKNQLPTQITERLEAVLRRVRRIQFFRGMLGVLTLSLSTILVIIAADYFFSPLSTVVRSVFFGGLIAVVLTSFWQLFLNPLNRKIELLQVARWLEVRHPEMQERISTSLELAGTSDAGVSADLLEELIIEAELDAKSLNPVIEVQSRKARVWLLPALGIAATFILLFAFWPAKFGRLLTRAVAPFSELGNAGAFSFDIAPGNLELLEDDSLEIRVLYQGPKDDILTIKTTNENGDVTQERLSFTGVEEGKQIAVYQLTTARESFSYRVSAGRNESDTYKVTVWPKPRLSHLDATYDYPRYTGLPLAKRELGNGGIQALAGTKISLNATTNTPVESGVFFINDKEIGPIHVEGSAKGGRISIDFSMALNQSGVGKIVLKHRLGQVIEAARFPVKALPDEAPLVSILKPVKRELKVKPTDQLTVTYQVLEKVGLQSAELDLVINGEKVPPLSQLLPRRDKQSKKSLWKGALKIYIGAILDQHPKAREIQLKVRIMDNRPADLGGANIGESETITLKLSRNAESLVRQELKAQGSDIRETAEKAVREIREAASKMDANRENIKKEELPKHAKKQLEEAREKLANAEKALEELAERMKNSVHAPKAEKAKKAAEKAKEARENLETAPLQDTPEARKKELDQAREAAKDALKELEQMRREIEQDSKKVEDIAQLNELAQKEQELARQAEKKAAEDPAEKLEANNKKDEVAQLKEDQEWKKKQREVQEQLRREINERPEAKAEVAKQQAEKARELAEQARDLSDKQEELEDLARQAKEQEQPEDQKKSADPKKVVELEEAIREQLEKEQRGLLQEAKEQLEEAQKQREDRADQLPEAVAEAEKALDQIRKDKPKEAAEAAREAAKTLKELAKPKSKPEAKPEAGEQAGAKTDTQKEQGDQDEQEKQNHGAEKNDGDAADPELRDLAERQEKVAEALEDLGEGKTDEALEALQELQADAADELAEDVKTLPEIDGKSREMAQAEQQAQHADNHAEEAAKQAAQDNQKAAADRNARAADALDKAAEALEAEAANLDAKAEQAAALAQQAQTKEAQKEQAPADGKKLAEAFDKAAKAAQADSPAAAAEAAREAAEALSELAQQAMQNMQEGKSGEQPSPKPGQELAGRPSEKPSEKPGEKPSETPGIKASLPTPDPGVPPELAKLGVSSGDWEKLKEMMHSDVAGGETSGVPEDYRTLVKKYFKEMAREGKQTK
ncbi:MAG: hypothetical protein ACI9E1_000331 [Cryomorphaceae bacterium]|jgi:hypothetical protein